MSIIQIDPIGTLYLPESAQPLHGWHVNATHPVAGWEAWRVTPAEPLRVFAGVPTVFYVFPDQAQFAQALQAAALEQHPPAPVPGDPAAIEP